MGRSCPLRASSPRLSMLCCPEPMRGYPSWWRSGTGLLALPRVGRRPVMTTSTPELRRSYRRLT